MADRIQEIIAKRIEKGCGIRGWVRHHHRRAVTGDLQHAMRLLHGLRHRRGARRSALALKAATGLLRTEVGKNLTARLTPSLEFIADAIPENAAAIDSLLREARERDAEAEKLASTAQYAGDEDPYVKPRDLDDEDDD